MVAWKPKPNPPHAPISPIQRNYAQKPKAVYPVFYGCALSKSLGLGKGDKPDLRRAFVPLPGDCKPDSDIRLQRQQTCCRCSDQSQAGVDHSEHDRLAALRGQQEQPRPRLAEAVGVSSKLPRDDRRQRPVATPAHHSLAQFGDAPNRLQRFNVRATEMMRSAPRAAMLLCPSSGPPFHTMLAVRLDEYARGMTVIR